MSRKPRIVLDTNIFISASFRKPSSIPDTIYQLVKSQVCILITSSAILEEIEDVINRKEIVKRTKTTADERKTFMQEIVEISFLVSGQESVKVIKDDPDDDKFLAAALEGNADYIVSGDHHLLDLKEYKSIPVLTPKDFLATLEDEITRE